MADTTSSTTVLERYVSPYSTPPDGLPPVRPRSSSTQASRKIRRVVGPSTKISDSIKSKETHLEMGEEGEIVEMGEEGEAAGFGFLVAAMC